MKTPLLALALLALPLFWQQEKPAPAPPPAPVVGEPAPAFRLNDHAGRAVSVGGKTELWTVVAFYPKAMTPG